MRVVRVLAGLSVAISVVGTAAGASAVAAQMRTTGGHAPGPITKVHASTAGSNGIALRWTNPPAAHFVHTVIRVTTNSSAPQTPSGGSKAAVVGRTKHAVVVGHLKPATHYRFALFATDGRGHYARRAVVAVRTAPGKVHNLRSYADGSAIALTWAAPATAYTDVVVRYAKGTVAPKHPWLGHGITLKGKKPTSATLAHLAANTAYAARVWTRDRSTHASTPATVHFTTAAKPAADGTITGHVTDAAGHPLAHADVFLLANSFTFVTFQTTTTSTGAFSTTVPAGYYYVWISGDNGTGGSSDTGYLPKQLMKAVASGKHASTGTVRLAAGGAYTGRVTDADGQPLAGVETTITTTPEYVWPSNGSPGTGSTVTDVTTAADGTFTLKSVPRDAVLICYDGSSAHAAGGSADTTYLAQCLDTPMSVAPRTTRRLPDAHLASTTASSSAGFTGRITGPDGAAVFSADVSFTRRGAGYEDGESSTAADGSYSVIGLAPGTYKVCVDTSSVVDNSATGVAGRCSAHVLTLTAGHVVTFDLALSRAAAISGTVTDHHGHRLGNVEVYLRLPADTTQFVATTDDDGQYVAKNLNAGNVRVCFDPAVARIAGGPANAAPGCVNAGAKIATEAGKVRTGADRQLPAGGSLRGRVTDGNGSPVANVAVHVTTADGNEFPDEEVYQLTGADGRYAVTGLAAGKYRLCFEANGFDTNFLGGGPGEVDHCTSRSSTVTVDHATTVDIDLPVSAAIDVSVHDGDGHPVAGVNAVALRKCSPNDVNCSHEPLFNKGKSTFVAGTYTSGGDGSADLYGLAPGSYAVCLFAYYGATTDDTPATGYADTCSGSTYTITVGKGQTAHTSLTLAVGGAVSGKVSDGAGHAVRGAAVRVAGSAVSDYDSGYPDFTEGPQAHAVTAGDGTYTIRSVQPGARTVCVDASAAKGVSAGGYLDQCVGSAAGSTDKPTTVTVAAGTTTIGTDVQLTAAGGLSGHITLGGKVGRDVQYIVMYPDGTWVDQGDETEDVTTTTNSSGNFTHLRLAAGTYVVCFYQYGYKSQCYQNVAWNEQSVPAQATRILVTAGKIVAGIDAAMVKK